MKSVVLIVLLGMAFLLQAPGVLAGDPMKRPSQSKSAQVDKEITDLIRKLENILQRQNNTTRRFTDAYLQSVGGPLRRLLNDEKPARMDNNGRRID